MPVRFWQKVSTFGEMGVKKIMHYTVFILLLPGTVMGLIPYFLLSYYPLRLEIGIWHYAGILILLFGVVFFFMAVLNFFLKGEGTPNVWMLRPLRFLIGEEPQRLVDSGIYQLTRNPMYLGVTGIVSGMGVLTGAVILIIYAVGLFLFYHLFVVLVEEPRLKKKHSQFYETYRMQVPRWIRIFNIRI